MVHFGLFWPKEVYFGPFRSANRALDTPDFCAEIYFVSGDFVLQTCCASSLGTQGETFARLLWHFGP